LGQNVNSYRPETGPSRDFATLIRQLDAIEGEHRIRFMTSHPKDCTRELLETLARTQHFCHHIHLPVQSGSDRVLAQMNRRYTAAHYLSLIDYAREVMPDVTFSSDILVGFPSETREDFEATLELVSHVRYNALFTFLYSRRSGTAAASLPDPVPADEKSLWLRELLSVQQDICQHLNEAMVGKNVCVLFDGVGKSGQGFLTGRTEGNIIVECEAPDALLGQFATVNVTRAMSGSVTGTLVTTGLLN
ncbi:MAG: radical SAM protein, partial [Oscillospiraceae bacterium]